MFMKENKPKCIFPTVDYGFFVVVFCHSDIRWCVHIWAKFGLLETERWERNSCAVAAVPVAVTPVNLHHHCWCTAAQSNWQRCSEDTRQSHLFCQYDDVKCDQCHHMYGSQELDLFASGTRTSPGFKINKTITFPSNIAFKEQLSSWHTAACAYS